uniref:Uncharacterized protein n=1 Tax=Arundo donax TaxID=35708 RepID=A0A0A9E0V0_ARUDO
MYSKVMDTIYQDTFYCFLVPLASKSRGFGSHCRCLLILHWLYLQVGHSLRTQKYRFYLQT